MNGAKRRTRGLSKTKTIAFSFLGIILAGAVLLTLPAASRNGQWTDFGTALFTATSACCVTGLVVVDTYTHWSFFGQLIILLMIQIGGLGTVAIGIMMAIFLRKNITLKSRNLLQESMNSLQIGGVVRLFRRAVKGTFILEAAGAAIMSFYFVPRLGFARGIYYGIFHSISAFCNAGFDLMGYQEQYSSLVSAVDSPLINIPVMVLIVVGGLGFIVWSDIVENKFHIRKYRFPSKLVLATSTVLIFGGAVLFYLFESDGVMAELSVSGKIYASLFCSVTPRTAGFNTVDTAALSSSGKMLTIILMFIGGSPGSTAGGIKTTSIAVIMTYVVSHLGGKSGANIFGRCISDETIKKAITIFVLNLALALSVSMIICGIQDLPAGDILFESFSAIGTVGMSTGVTRQLGGVARILMILLMYMGRIGSMTFAFSLTEGRKASSLQLPKSDVPIG